MMTELATQQQKRQSFRRPRTDRFARSSKQSPDTRDAFPTSTDHSDAARAFYSLLAGRPLDCTFTRQEGAVMSACPACGKPFRSEDVVTSRLGQFLHSRCVERWR